MLARLVAASVNSPGYVLVLVLLVVGFGINGMLAADLAIFPEFAAPSAIVQTEAPGLTAVEVEQRVTRPVEAAFQGLPRLKLLRSESIAGLSVVQLEFAEGTPLGPLRQQVAERLASRLDGLPEDINPVLVPRFSSSATVYTLGVTAADGDLLALRDYVDVHLVPRILAVPGVADVHVFGGLERALSLRPDWSALRQFDLDLDQLAETLRMALTPLPLGVWPTPVQELDVVMSSPTEWSEALAKWPIALPDAALGWRSIGQFSTPVWGHLPPVSAAQIGGEAGVILMVVGAPELGTARVSANLEAVLEGLDVALQKKGIALHAPLFRPADYVHQAVDGVVGHLALGGLTVVLVLSVFLADWRTVLIASTAVPLSLLAAFASLQALGSSLNLMVIGGLAIALGEVVDDAIIDCENIRRRLSQHHRANDAPDHAQVIYAASMEVRGSVVFATLIVATAFIPLFTLGGLTGRLFAPLGYAYVLAIMASLLVAMTVTPALCRLGLQHHQQRLPHSSLTQWLTRRYQGVQARLFRHPGVSVFVVMAATALTIAPFARLGGNFLPELREGHFLVHVTALPGTSLSESLRLGRILGERFEAIDGVVSVSQWAGRAERGADTFGGHYSEFDIRLAPLPGAQQGRIAAALREILDQSPGITFELNTFLTERIGETESGFTAPVAVVLYGEDLDLLDSEAAKVEGILRAVPGATGVRRRSVLSRPELRVQVTPQAYGEYGVDPGVLARTVATAVAGLPLGHVPLETRSIPVLLQGDDGARVNPAHWGDAWVRTQRGWVALKELVSVIGGEGRYNVHRRNGRRVQTVTADVVGRDLDTFIRDARERLAEGWQPDALVEFELAGAAVEQMRGRNTLYFHAALVGIGVLALARMVLGSTNNVLLVVLNLPFALAGGVLAAQLSGGVLSVGATIGFVTLFGITVRNAIMLIAHYQYLVTSEGAPWDATTALRGAVERFPSIMMTAMVTALAMLPIAVDSDNPGREIMGPMATIIIGGLFSSVLLTLLVLPLLVLRFGRFAKATEAGVLSSGGAA